MIRAFITWLVVSLALLPALSASAQQSSDWSTTTAEEQGMDSVRLADGLRAIRDSGMPIHSLLLVRDGQLVVEAYFYPYDGVALHDQASVTKSVTTTLIGIAIDQEKLSLDDPMPSFFPDRTVANRDARKEAMTVGHLASMTTGMECVGDPDEPQLAAMERSPDFVQFALDLPMVTDPGTTYSYCSPGMHLLSAVLTRATGMSEFDFAREYLFKPLGITEVIWPADAQGVTHGWGDLYLHPRDAAKFGQLWLNGGQWNGTQVVSSEWVQASYTVQAIMPADAGEDYGYGWRIERDSAVGGKMTAAGRGGQRVAVLPALNAVVAINGGGIDPDDALDLLTPALVDPINAIAPNLEGQKILADTYPALLQAPEPGPVAPLPGVAREISGVSFCLSENPLGLATIVLTFDETADATVRLTFSNGNPEITGLVGLDGLYRLAPGRNGYQFGMRGAWLDDQTFGIEFDEIANLDAYLFSLQFNPDGTAVTFTGRERSNVSTITIEGTACP